MSLGLLLRAVVRGPAQAWWLLFSGYPPHTNDSFQDPERPGIAVCTAALRDVAFSELIRKNGAV
jgi:uncharacterized membrane protein